MLKMYNSNPNSNPDAPNNTMCQSRCHNLRLNSYPKKFQQVVGGLILFHFLKQKNLCNSPPHHSKNHIGHPWKLSTQWHSIEVMAWATIANLNHFDTWQLILNRPTFCTYWLFTYSLAIYHPQCPLTIYPIPNMY